VLENVESFLNVCLASKRRNRKIKEEKREKKKLKKEKECG